MNALLLAFAFITFFVATLGLWRPAEPFVKAIYAWLPAPVLILGIFSIINNDLGVTEFPSLLMSTTIGLDVLGRAFLILTTSAWLLAGIYSRRYLTSDDQERLFRFYFLITYSGTIGLIIAQDALTFYAGYALMTIGGYGLIVQTRAQAAYIAGRVYMVVALIGEMLTLAGLIIAASTATGVSFSEISYSIEHSPMGPLSFWLIFLGFGTKVGLVPLHFWLPRAYYWSPLPAVAVLSGAMTKAGILGWLRFLPPIDSHFTASLIIAAGTLMAFYGVVFGIVQTRAKTTLAFSSLSQMGYLTIAFGTLMDPRAIIDESVVAIVAYSFHHGITKVALFLGLGVLAHLNNLKYARYIVLGCLSFCALALVGFPLTGGAYAKALLKNAGAIEGVWHSVSGVVMTLGSIGTTLLMLRFIILCWRKERDQVRSVRGYISWSLAFAFVLFGAWTLPNLISFLGLEIDYHLTLAASFKMYLPIFFGTLIGASMTYKIWMKQSQFTPRPFDTILQGVYKSVWEDFPRKINLFINAGTNAFYSFKHSLRIEERGGMIARRSQELKTSWALGCTLFIGIGVLIWLFFAVGVL